MPTSAESPRAQEDAVLPDADSESTLTTTEERNITGPPVDTPPKEGHISMYCGLKVQVIGSYFHWAFVIYVWHGPQKGWHVFEATKGEAADSKYEVVHRELDPERPDKFFQPLICVGFLYQNDSLYRDMMDRIAMVDLDVKDASCSQYFVLQVWAKLHTGLMTSYFMWHYGRSKMMEFFGPDFGMSEGRFDGDADTYSDDDDDDDDYSDEEAVYAWADEVAVQAPPKSAEFVYDSD